MVDGCIGREDDGPVGLIGMAKSEAWPMNNGRPQRIVRPRANPVNHGRREPGMPTYDSATDVDKVRAIDEALKRYYGAENWIAVRRKLQPGIK